MPSHLYPCNHRRPSPILLCLVLALVQPIFAQTETVPDHSFAESVDVDLVNVEAWVTDRKGRAVAGLGPEDFEVREDGEVVEVSFFAEIRQEGPGRGAPAREPLRPKVEPKNAEPPQAPAHLVLYFDQLHLQFANRKRVLRDVRQFIRTQRVPAERILLLTQDQRLATAMPFGSSQETLEAILAEFAEGRGFGSRAAFEKRSAVQDLQRLWDEAQVLISSGNTGGPGAAASGGGGAACDYFVPRSIPLVERFTFDSRNRAALTLDHLASTATFLSGAPGAKTLVYISDGLETDPGTDLLEFIHRLCPESRKETSRVTMLNNLSEPLRGLTRHANANQVTIYALQASGLQNGFMISPEQAAVDTRVTHIMDGLIRGNERDGLHLLATETGGRAILNKNRLAGELSQIAEEMYSYYSLAYVPPHGGDGLQHRIQVRAKNSALRVRHRRSYVDKGADEKMGERLQGALYLGLVDNRMDLRLGHGNPEALGKGRYRLPLHILVPSTNITFLPGQNGSRARLKLQARVHSDEDRRIDLQEQLFTLDDPSLETQRMVLLVEITTGVVQIAVALRDEASREASYVSTTLGIKEQN